MWAYEFRAKPEHDVHIAGHYIFPGMGKLAVGLMFSEEHAKRICELMNAQEVPCPAPAAKQRLSPREHYTDGTSAVKPKATESLSVRDPVETSMRLLRTVEALTPKTCFTRSN